MRKKRIVLWKKQRQFLEMCMGTEVSVGQAMNKLHITNKMLALWLTRPGFLHHYRKARRFLVQRRELDLIIGATRGADLLNRGLSSKSRQKKPAVEMVKLARDSRDGKARGKKERAVEKPLAHPSHSEEEVLKLLDIVEGKRPAD